MKINIVGGGIAGMYAAALLLEHGYKPTLIEASSVLGGRIRSKQDFTDFPIELGASFVQGKYSLFYEHLLMEGKEPMPLKGKTYLFHNNQLLSKKKALKIQKFEHLLSFVENIWLYKGEEKTLSNAYLSSGGDPALLHVLDGLSSEYGANAQQIGCKSLGEEESRWTAGIEEMLVRGSMISGFEKIIERVKPYTLFNSPVSEILYKKDGVTILSKTALQCDKVLVTVSLGVLKSGSIIFSPALPATKTEAINGLGMGNGMKVFLKFSDRFWKKKMAYLYGGKLCQEYSVTNIRQPSKTWVLCAYCVGEQALMLGQLPDDESIIGAILGELDEMYGDKAASKHFEKGYVIDWSKDLYTKGTYSFATPYSDGLRQVLAEPIGTQVYFAGEATALHGHNSTIHGAMESAERAVREMLKG